METTSIRQLGLFTLFGLSLVIVLCPFGQTAFANSADTAKTSDGLNLADDPTRTIMKMDESDNWTPATEEEVIALDSNEEGVATISTSTHADSWFSFPFASVGSTWATSGRQKDESTSAYLRVTTLTMDSCKVYIDGANSQSGSWTNCVTYWDGSVYVGGNSATVDSLGQKRIMNNVNERGYSYARLTGWAHSEPGTLAGYWSPDCYTSNYSKCEVIND